MKKHIKTMAAEPFKHNSIEKALVILWLFATKNQEFGTLEISKIFGYHKATTSRILLLLTQHGYLEQNRQTKKFRLGHTVVNLGLAVSRYLRNNLVQIAKPYVDACRDLLRETVVIKMISGRNTITAYIAEGPRRVRLGGEVGSILPTNLTAGTKAILAFASPMQQDDFFDHKFIKYTKRSMTDPAKIKNQLKKIKGTKLAIDVGEHNIDLNAMGSPILNAEGQAVAAVVAVGLATRIGKDPDSMIAREVIKTAEAISKRLYYTEDILGLLPKVHNCFRDIAIK